MRKERQQMPTFLGMSGPKKTVCISHLLPFILRATTTGTTTDHTGHYMLINLPEGVHVVVAKSMGYYDHRDTIKSVKGQTLELNFILKEKNMSVDGSCGDRDQNL